MAVSGENTTSQEPTFALGDVDLSVLVGHEVTLFTDQYQGKPLCTKVVMANNGVIALDRSGSNGLIDSLITNQQVVVQFVLKGQRISVDAQLKRTSGGKCTLALGEKLTPLSRRRFRRFDIERPVKCAVLPSKDFNAQRLSKLRWIETASINISSGGLLMSLPKQVADDSYLLLNVEIDDIDFPALIIGQVRYSYPIDSFRFNIGIEFVISDLKEKHFAPTTIQKMPPVVFGYTASRRKELNRELAVQMQKISKQEL